MNILASSRRAALTLLEMMVAVTLLALIMIGLLAMFQQVQKALHVAHAQTDVFENARGAMQMIARDLGEMSSAGTNPVNAIGQNGALPGRDLPIPGQAPVSVRFEQAFWLTRANDDWQGIGYFVAEDEVSGKTNSGVGTLYRTLTNSSRTYASKLFQTFLNAGPDSPEPHRVSDGIVHFAFVPTYPNGTNSFVKPINAFNFPRRLPDGAVVEIPAYVDVEIGVLEPATLKQFRALQDFDGPAAQNFLRNNVGRIHFFRERVPIRNFVNPYRANEVP